jgi:hypothetical protein
MFLRSVANRLGYWGVGSRTGFRTPRTLPPLKPRFVSSLTPTLKDSYEYVLVDSSHRETGVGLITLHRPKALNALCDDLFLDLIHAATALDHDDTIGCLVLTGSTKAFAAGADISEMKDRTYDYAYKKVGFCSYVNHGGKAGVC